MADQRDNHRDNVQESNNEIKATIERDASLSPDPLNIPDSYPILNNTEERAEVPPAFNKIRAVHQAADGCRYPSGLSPRSILKKSSRVAEKSKMSYEGVDLTAEAGQSSTTISWHDPHPMFVILLVGPDEIPFGIQKDLLCAQSPHYRQEFAHSEARVENIVKLPDTDTIIFGCFQNFIYTGAVYDKPSGKPAPDYTVLLGVWKLATELRMAPLRVAVLDTMAERRQQTGFIPSTELLVQAWRQTEEGSGLRKMLVGWVAEHMRSTPDDRHAIVQSMPREILSALVVVLSGIPAEAAVALVPSRARPSTKHTLILDEVESEQTRPAGKRVRRSVADLANPPADEAFEVKPTVKKPARKSEPARRTVRRASTHVVTVGNDPNFTPEKELEYCRGLIDRMVSGPGYWTRYVTNFKKPVDPMLDNVPNYFDVVKKPMALETIKAKMDANLYNSGADFEADIKQIFQNCYEYWTPDDPIWKECETFQRFFETQWDVRHKYAANHGRKVKAEVIE